MVAILGPKVVINVKFCERCGEEIYTKDGENLCAACETETDRKRKRSNRKARLTRREREAVLRDLGLTKVRGSLGGTYWE